MFLIHFVIIVDILLKVFQDRNNNNHSRRMKAMFDAKIEVMAPVWIRKEECKLFNYLTKWNCKLAQPNTNDCSGTDYKLIRIQASRSYPDWHNLSYCCAPPTSERNQIWHCVCVKRPRWVIRMCKWRSLVCWLCFEKTDREQNQSSSIFGHEEMVSSLSSVSKFW